MSSAVSWLWFSGRNWTAAWKRQAIPSSGSDIKQDLEALQEITIAEQDKTLAVRTECIGACGKIFQAVGVAIPPAIREL